MLRERWNQVTDHDTKAMINEALQLEDSVQFAKLEGRWYAVTLITVQGTRVARHYFEVMDNEHINMLNSVTGQVRNVWAKNAAEALQAAATTIGHEGGGGGL